MKIGNPSELYRTGASAAGASTIDAEKARTPVVSGESASVESSASVKLSGSLEALKAHMGPDGAFDSKRVEQIKAAIADGSFKVNANVVADKVISSNLEALARSTSK